MIIIEKTSLNKLLKQNFNSDYIFRGHANSLWKITSSFDRMAKKSKLICGSFERYWNYAELLSKRLKLLKNYNGPYWNCKENFRNIDFLTKVQHYGFPTPYIDWTTDILIALYFSLQGNFSSPCIFVLNMEMFKKNQDQNKLKGSIDSFKIKFLKPLVIMTNSRIDNQQSIFSYTELTDIESIILRRIQSNGNGNSNSIFKKYQITDSKKNLQQYLKDKGITDDFIFPIIDVEQSIITACNDAKNSILDIKETSNVF